MRHRLILCFALGVLSWSRLDAQSGPLAYVLPASDRVFVVLADTPREAQTFEVYRRDPGAREFVLLTPQPIGPTSDAHEAARLMGTDFRWLARRVGTLDAEAVWRKIRYDRGQSMAYSLISHGLRLALGRTYVDSDVTPGRSYRYRVQLLDAAGRSAGRVEQEVTVAAPTEPSAPSSMEATPRDGEVLIRWEYPAYKGREDDRAVGFHLYRAGPGGADVRLTPAPILRVEGFLSYLDRKVINGDAYIYSLEAVDVIGVAGQRIRIPPVVPRDNRPPLIPGDLTALDEPDGVVLIWAMSPELDVASYNVYSASTLGEEEELTQLNAQPVPWDSPRYVDGDATKGSLQIYRVTAVDQSGNESPPSGPTTITPKDPDPPAVVTGLSGIADKETREVTLNWSPSPEEDLLGYHVYRGSDEDHLVRIAGQVLTEVTYTDIGYEGRGQRAGAHVFYAVSGVDTSYNEGPRAVVEIAVPDEVPPEAPVGLTARATPEGHVRLRWRPSYVPDLEKAHIYRRTDGDWEQVARVDALSAEWSDTGTTRGVTTHYRVTQLDGVGNESPPCPETVIVPTDVVAPEPPAVTGVSSARNGVRVEWAESAAEDIAGYRLYWSSYEGSRWRLVTADVLETTEYLVRRGDPKRLYGVSAVDTSGNEGPVGPGRSAE